MSGFRLTSVELLDICLTCHEAQLPRTARCVLCITRTILARETLRSPVASLSAGETLHFATHAPGHQAQATTGTVCFKLDATTILVRRVRKRTRNAPLAQWAGLLRPDCEPPKECVLPDRPGGALRSANAPYLRSARPKGWWVREAGSPSGGRGSPRSASSAESSVERGTAARDPLGRRPPEPTLFYCPQANGARSTGRAS